MLKGALCATCAVRDSVLREFPRNELAKNRMRHLRTILCRDSHIGRLRHIGMFGDYSNEAC
jgi:hypothetical protein